MLWPEDMPPNTLICMSRADKLVPNDLVLRHLKAAGSHAKASVGLCLQGRGILSDMVMQICT